MEVMQHWEVTFEELVVSYILNISISYDLHALLLGMYPRLMHFTFSQKQYMLYRWIDEL